ncbi:MAG: hypothetical protein K2M47_06740 [Clostridiales bacterium]|nr:hypothetical protein [Clostridiales bacterium]
MTKYKLIYEITRNSFNGNISRTFSEVYNTRKAAQKALANIDKEYAQSEITRAEIITIKTK